MTIEIASSQHLLLRLLGHKGLLLGRVEIFHLRLTSKAELIVDGERHVPPSLWIVVIGQDRCMTGYVLMSLPSLALATIRPLLLLVLLEHALVDLIAFENLRLAPFLQLVLHIFAHAHF